MPSTAMLIRCGAVQDSLGTLARPGGVVVDQGRIVWSGALAQVPARYQRQATVHEHPDRLLLPLLVNAHAHLDLAGLGPQPRPAGFVDWVKGVMRDRPREPQELVAAVHAGLQASRAAGVGHLADIAASEEALAARLAAPAELALPGVSYLEVIGQGRWAATAADAMPGRLGAFPFETPVPGRERGVLLGLQPHAPYSTGAAIYERAAALSRERIVRLSTHLSETAEELTLFAEGGGPLAELLRDLGRWDASLQEVILAAGGHPIDALAGVLRQARWLLAHVNYLTDAHLNLLARARASVVYCPIASDYFGQPIEGGHRYRDMLDAGINVCLGTDSVLCQPGDQLQPHGILPQMRHLFRRDQTDPARLLEMATVNGLAAMDLNICDASLRRGAPGAFLSVAFDPADPADPLAQALGRNEPGQVIEP